MRISKEGEWTVTTPLYIGTADQVQNAQRCNHATYSEVSSAVIEGQRVICEKCLNCVASRVRYRQATPEEITEKKS